MHDTHVRAQTALGVAEINAASRIITQDKDHRHDAEQFEKVAEHEDKQLAAQEKKRPE